MIAAPNRGIYESSFNALLFMKSGVLCSLAHKEEQKGGYRMNKKKIWCVVILTVLSLVSLSSQSFGGDSPRSRATLSGLNGVYFRVARLTSEIIKDGLAQEQIEKDVKNKLDAAGIKVLSDTEGRRQFGNPYLHVIPVINKTKTGLYLCFITLEFVQDARLVRNRNFTRPLPTWSVGVQGAMYKNFSERVRNHIKDLMDRFINAYLSVN